MTNFLKKIGLMLLPILAMASFNLSIDPQMLFNKKPLRHVVQELEGRETAECYSDFDERVFKKMLLQSPRFQNVDILVLGSSRAMTINGDAFPGKTVLNLAVSGATLEDLLALWQLAQERIQYRELIIGLDPWILNPEHGDVRWKSLVADYNEALKKIQSDSQPATDKSLWRSKIKEIFSPLYFKDSLMALSKGKASLLGVRQDGSVIYRSAPPPEKETGAPIYKMSPFPKLKKSYKKDLDLWLKLLSKSDKPVIIWLPPFRPDTYERLESESDYAMFREARLFLRTECERFQFTTLGSYNPSALQLETQDFRDEIHLKPEAVAEQMTEVREALDQREAEGAVSPPENPL